MKNHLVVPLSIVAALICLFAVLPGTISAEWFASGYLGAASTPDSDVELSLPGGTHLTFNDVTWDDESFSGPIYYGLRTGYWFESRPNLGVALDFTHAKMMCYSNQLVQVSGTRQGAPIAGQERLGDTFDELSFSHGHNLLTLNGMYRWMELGRSGRDFLNRLQPYVLAGLGVAYPHVEVAVAGSDTYEYQAAGIAAQAGGGLDVDITRWLSVFAEYRLSYAEIDADLAGGGSLQTEPWTHHFMSGVTFSFLH